MSKEGQHTLVRGHQLHVHYDTRERWSLSAPKAIKAIDGADISIARKETVSLVGESGSGKSTVGRVLLGAEQPTFGSVTFDGEDLTTVSRKRWMGLRGSMQLIFQNAGGSFNPRLTIGDQLEEAIFLQKRIGPKRVLPSIGTTLDRVGLSKKILSNFAFELSGGQQQRAAIARTLLCRPEFIVCDEIVSALDLSVQAQIINLLRELQNDLGIAYLFISHDLAVVRYLSDRVAVMYFGRIVETGESERVFSAPRHPYTKTLLEAAPSMKAGHRTGIRRDAAPTVVGRTAGCRFLSRCAVAGARCEVEVPRLAGREQHLVACHHPIQADRDD